MYKCARLLTSINARHIINRRDVFRKVHIHRKHFLGERLKVQHVYFPSIVINKRNLCTRSILQNENIEEVFAALSVAYNEHSRVYPSNILNALEKSNLKNINGNQGLLLLQCCGHVIGDRTLQVQAELCDTVWEKLEECGITFHIEHYNTYLQVSAENKVKLNLKKYLSEMKCEPNNETYNLLLECVCEIGDTQQAIEIVAVMKEKGYPADERVFDALVLGHSINGGLKDAQTVLETMQVAHIPVTSRTHFALIRGLACRSNFKELMHALQMHPGVKEQELLSLLLAIGLNGNHNWLKEILQIVGPIKLSKQGIQQLDLLCRHLIHSGQPEAAIKFYKKFVDHITGDDRGDYALSLLIEMLYTSTPSKILIDVAKDLKESNMNTSALEKVTGLALRQGFHKEAWELLETFPSLRPHYFWPLLIQAEKQGREIGVLNVIERMLDWNVKIDLDTLEFYCIPFCDTEKPLLLIARLQNSGLTIKEVLCPLLGFLLRKNRISKAEELCKKYDSVSIMNRERLLPPLVKAWHSTGDAENIVLLLQKFSTSAAIPTEYLGLFLLRCLRLCQTPEHHEQFLELLKMMHSKKLHISMSTSDTLLRRMKLPIHKCELNTQILKGIDNLTNPSVNQGNSHIAHPRNMNVSELECHLIELRNKNMEIRGILRRLIQEYARLGNQEKVNEFRQQFNDAGYLESTGMKAALLYVYIVNDNMDGAMNTYHEIKKTDPLFIIDSFKVLDLGTLLINNGQFDKAIDIIKNETKDRPAQGGPTIVRNCWHLLGAANDEVQVEKLFDLLIERGFCVPSNIILGPLVRVHLKKGDLTKAAQVFSNFGERFRYTPLQIELLCAVVKAEDEKLLQEILNVVSRVHGADAASISLITVLAQSGLQKSLRKFLLEVKNIDKKEMERRCRRWIKEDKVFPLQTLANATYKLPIDILNRSMIHQCIMQIHSIHNDCESAVKFYQQLLEKEEYVPKQLVDDLLCLVSRCKYKMPDVLKVKEQC